NEQERSQSFEWNAGTMKAAQRHAKDSGEKNEVGGEANPMKLARHRNEAPILRPVPPLKHERISAPGSNVDDVKRAAARSKSGIGPSADDRNNAEKSVRD